MSGFLRRHLRSFSTTASLLLVASLFSGVGAPSAAAAGCDGSNRWVYLSTGPSSGVRAQLALGAASATTGGSQNVYVSVGGNAFLDIIQVGARVRPDGSRRFFAAWGRGTPNTPGSLYLERDLGPTNRSWHTYELRLLSGTWVLRIDGVIRLRVADSFRTWKIYKSMAAIEAEPPNARLGGTKALPARVQSVRVLIAGSWRLPAKGSYGSSSWYQGGYCVPPSTRDTFGRDWLKVWM